MGKKKASRQIQNSAAACPILPHLYLGPRTSASMEFVTRHHITEVLSIGSQPPSIIQGVIYHRLSLLDDMSSSIRSVSEDANNIIKAVGESPNRIILIHCSAAVSRSPTLVAAYLMKHCGMSLYDALARIISVRPAVCPNPGFLRQLRELEQDIFSSQTVHVDELPRTKKDRLRFFGGTVSPA
ncbi:hypothetical protein TWF694_007975 [Orbilia ellipsospora]|uniref:protein-tyrosine-phosphatase n=1 Tax=Orbilia ellipsospora TaxID=2528407 RepID=A0AAV9XKT3_9PEZI